MTYVYLSSRALIGIVFAMSAFTKLRSRSAFRSFVSWLSALPVPLARTWPRACAVLMTGAECAVVLLLALAWTWPAGLLLAGVILAVFAIGTLVALRHGASTPCQCFGTAAVPLGRHHLVRNLLLCGVAVAGAAGETAATAGTVPPAGAVTSLGAGVVVALFVVFYDDLTVLLAVPRHHSGESGGF